MEKILINKKVGFYRGITKTQDVARRVSISTVEGQTWAFQDFVFNTEDLYGYAGELHGDF